MAMFLRSDIFPPGQPRREWVRLRTLIYLRWLAVLGQTITLIVATEFFHIDIRLDIGFLLVGLAALFNVALTVVYPENKRLSNRGATWVLLFDVAQLSSLLYITGGLDNPFSVLILGQAIIAASILTLESTILLGVVSLIAIATLARFHVKLTLISGEMLEVPPLLVTGTWIALSIAIVFLSVYARRVTVERSSMSEALTATQLALERERRLTALGGVVAAAAHELGTPLATIKLASGELRDELKDRPEIVEDLELIAAQADRCSEILASMGRSGKDDPHLHQAPFSAVIEEAAEPHLGRGKTVNFRIRGETAPGTALSQPEIPRRPEIIHGVRNLVQNAVDFARAQVWVDIDWSETRLILRIGDDGRGYPPELLGRIGDPFLRRRRSGGRPGYAGMGLGLFIAKTLLERTGARLTFANGVRPDGDPAAAAGASPPGAIVEVLWDRADLELGRSAVRGALGANRPIAG